VKTLLVFFKIGFFSSTSTCLLFGTNGFATNFNFEFDLSFKADSLAISFVSSTIYFSSISFSFFVSFAVSLF